MTEIDKHAVMPMPKEAQVDRLYNSLPERVKDFEYER